MSSYAAQDVLVESPANAAEEALPQAGGARITPGQLIVLGMFAAGIGLIYLYVAPLVAGVLYAVGYMALTWLRPDLALLVMFAATAFPYDVGGGPVKMAIAEISLVLATPILLIRTYARHEPLARNPIKWPVLAYFGVCVASSATNGITKETLSSMGQMVVYMVLAVFVFSSCLNQRHLFRSAFTGLLISATFVSVMLTATRQQYLFGIHKNANGVTLSYGLVIAGELWFAEQDSKRKRRLGLLALVIFTGLFFSLSRGAWVGAASGLGLIAALRRRFKLLLRGAIVAGLVIAIAWQFLPGKDKNYLGDVGAHAHNVKTRLVSVEYAMHYFETSPMLGVGVGLRKQYDATNVVLAILAETGIAGLVTFMSIFFVFFGSVWRNRRRIGVDDPTFSLLAIGAGLMLCQFLHGLVDHYWSRVLLVVWASAGMAIYAIDRSRRRVSGAEAPV